MAPFDRAAGILLHPTSLPGFGGIGTLGAEAYRFVDFLQSAGMRHWQVLPLGPTGYGDAPYSTHSALAGNPYLVALDPLIEEGLLLPADLDPLRDLPETHVDFGRLVPAKSAVLRAAFRRVQERGAADASFVGFVADNRAWLDDFALFMALKDEHNGASWIDWEPALRGRQPAALERARERLADTIELHRHNQYHFFAQWTALKAYANQRDISIVGDIPIFVAFDSADVWANQSLFKLDDDGRPTVVAGVPPDYFSATGQLWGNPHYRWERLRDRGFDWWVERFRMLLRVVDAIRLDHFRGFAGAWEVPYGDDTAVRGEWVDGPGREMFDAIRASLGDVPIIAEDLGVITPDVEELRDGLGLPGMKILQFAFSTDAADPSLPHNFTRDTVVYPGTHDNDTTVGWFASLPDSEQLAVTRYTGASGADVSWDLIRLAIASVAVLAVVSMQDVLRLGSAARMNFPGRPEGNWTWRFTPGAITALHVRQLRQLNETYGRCEARADGASFASQPIRK